MPDFGYFSQNIGGAIDRLLCRTLEKRPHRLPEGRFVTLCFDDFPKSAVDIAAPMIEVRDWRATWYVAGGYCGQMHPRMGAMFDRHDLERLVRAGHDFGCHTFDHVDCRSHDPEAVADQCRRNLTFLNAAGIRDLASFAYPFGEVNLAAKTNPALSDYLRRGVKTGLNRGVADLALLKAVGLQANNGGIARALRSLRTLKNADGWLIIFTHDVREQPSPWGATPSDYARLLQAVEESGADVVTMAEMAARLNVTAPSPAMAA